MDEPPNTGSEAFERTRLTFEHPGEPELHDHAEAPMAVGIDPQDGLPRVASSSWDQHLSPALDPETLICMEDASQYVVRDAGGRIAATFAPAEVEQAPTGPVVHRSTLLTRLELENTGTALRFALGFLFEGPLVPVTPVRPQCRYYARQIIDFPGELGHIMVRRFCRANRTDEGEYESLREVQVHACELRDPSDRLTEKKIHDFDIERIRLGRVRRAESETRFDVVAELKRAEGMRAQNYAAGDIDRAVSDEADGGIFNPRR